MTDDLLRSYMPTAVSKSNFATLIPAGGTFFFSSYFLLLSYSELLVLKESLSSSISDFSESVLSFLFLFGNAGTQLLDASDPNRSSMSASY